MSKAKFALAAFVWLIILAVGAMLYRLWWVPAKDQQQRQAEAEVVAQTSGTSNYKHHVKLGLDGFSGYAILRSDEMASQLRAHGIKLETVDDGADYGKRLAGLADGSLHLAAFPIDALLKASQAKNALPATIIAIIDETRGADALVAYRAKFPNIDSLNSTDTKFVLVGDSPSETLLRVLMHDFKLEQVKTSSIVSVKDSASVLARYRAAAPAGNEVFVTWEPIVSQLLENDQMHVLVDSSRQSGYIVDALVASRDFLVKNETVVRQIVEAYFRALHAYNDPQRLEELVIRDAQAASAPVTAVQAKRLVNGIAWKNTQENLAHFGLRTANVSHVEDMIDRIKRVLTDTGGLSADPTGGDSKRLFFEAILREIQASGFHPGIQPEEIRQAASLVELTDEHWKKLEPVGTISVPPLVFARGQATLSEASHSILDELAEKLSSWPQYYVLVRANVGSRGDMSINRRIADQRVQSVLQYLQSKGVPVAKLKSVPGEILDNMSVSFVFGQLPY